MRYIERRYREKRVQTAGTKHRDFKEMKVFVKKKSQIMEMVRKCMERFEKNQNKKDRIIEQIDRECMRREGEGF
jgi:hypothetical protein